MKTISLGELLQRVERLSLEAVGESFHAWAGVYPPEGRSCYPIATGPACGPTPEGALQALAEAICGPDVVLVITTSARAAEVTNERVKSIMDDHSDNVPFIPYPWQHKMLRRYINSTNEPREVPTHTRMQNLQRRVDEQVAAHPELLNEGGKVSVSLPPEGTTTTDEEQP